jgi:predicted RNase H-like nuclease (RuvC/YqgF family)
VGVVDRDFDSLKMDVRNLVSRIGSAKGSRPLSPEGRAVLNRMREAADLPLEIEELYVDFGEPKREEEETVVRTEEKKVKSKGPSIRETDQECKRLEEENRGLKRQLGELSKTVEQSKKEMAALHKALQNSLAIRNKMLQQKNRNSRQIQQTRK